MTEAEWLACEDRPLEMLNHLETEAQGRSAGWRRFTRWLVSARSDTNWQKPALHRRLYLAACGMRRLGRGKWSRAGLDEAYNIEERFADGLLSLEALIADDPERRWWWPDPWHLVSNVIRSLSPEGTFGDDWPLYCHIFRDVFGNPFRGARIATTRRTAVVSSLALSAYQEREHPPGCLEPARLGVLADALEEAGCTDTDILTHLRSPGPHVRGCWALDLVLAKE